MDQFHAHIYYDSKTLEQAKILVEKANEKEGIKIGRMHERPVGPHPTWSCQLLFSKEKLTEMIIWLLESRKGLSIFIHPVTGDDVLDHTEYAIWLGQKWDLDLKALS